MYEPIEGAKKILQVNLGFKPRESVLILAEDSTSEDAKYFLMAGKELDLNIVMLIMPDLNFNGEEPLEIVKKAMQLPEAMLIASKSSISTTNARVQASQKGVRIFSMPSFTSDMLIRGPIEADFLKIKPRIWTLAGIMDKANIVKIKSKNGSDLTFSIEGRSGRAMDALARESGSYRSMSVEACIAPLENTADGILMVDVAAPTNIIFNKPVKLTFKKGFIVKIEGNDNAMRLQKFLDEVGDKNIFRIAELGIGLNPSSKLTGKNYIEDESSLGTGHIGIGRNTSLGGETQAKGHFDMIFNNPDIFFDDTCIIKNGQLVI